MVSIAVVDDSHRWLTAAENKLKDMAGFELAGSFCDGIDFIRFCFGSTKLPDIAAIDIEMLRIDGVHLTDFLSDHFPSIKVIGVSSHSAPELVADMIACGAYGFISKLFNMQNWKEGVETVANGDIFIDPLLGDIRISRDELVAERQKQKTMHDQLGLTTRQSTLASLYSAAVNQKEIARMLSISPKTAENHISRISAQLGVSSRQEFTLRSIRAGLVKIARIFTRYN
jgi:DNA-binding NarL/FixJ family response regulator